MARVTDTNAIAVLRPTSIASVQATVGIRCDGWSQVVGTIRIQPSGAGDIDLRVQFADKRDPDEEDWVTTGFLSITPNGGEESFSIRTPVAGVRVRLHISVDDTVETTATILRMAETDLAEASPRGVIFSYAAEPNETDNGTAAAWTKFAATATMPGGLLAGDVVDVMAEILDSDGATLETLAGIGNQFVGASHGAGTSPNNVVVFRMVFDVVSVGSALRLVGRADHNIIGGSIPFNGGTTTLEARTSAGATTEAWAIPFEAGDPLEIGLKWSGSATGAEDAVLKLLSVLVRRP